MFKQRQERRVAARRHRIAMRAAHRAYGSAVVYTPVDRNADPTVEDVVNLAYGSNGVRLTVDEARDALAAVLAEKGRRLNAPAA